MKFKLNFIRKVGNSGISMLCAAIALFPTVGISQESNFGKLELSPSNPFARLRGTTGGTASLPAIVSQRDRNNHKCLGFADPRPDHILVLEKPFDTLSLNVQSKTDTTLVVQGPNGSVQCGDDAGSNKNAAIADRNWQAGTYKIWVGTAEPKTQQDYVLTIQP